MSKVYYCVCIISRCEQGDLTGKHGQLDISPDGDDRPTYTYVDSNLQLAGDTTSKKLKSCDYKIRTVKPLLGLKGARNSDLSISHITGHIHCTAHSISETQLLV